MLVLGAGGIAGAVWLNGVLAGIEETTGIDVRKAECFVGTSAGSIVAARLCAGRRPRPPADPAPTGAAARGAGRPASAAAGPRAAARGAARRGSVATGPPAAAGGGERPASVADAESPAAARGRDPLSALGSAAAPLVGPFLPFALAASAPGSALARRAILAIAPRGRRTHHDVIRELDRLQPRFDGRLRVCCVDTSSGRRVVFGAPGAPDASVTEAVAASCSIPGMYAPVRIGRRDYVDGGLWSPTNLDVAVVARGTRVLCLNPLGAIGAHSLSTRSMIGGAIRLSEAVEATVLRRRGAAVQTIVPDAACRAAMGTDLMSPAVGHVVAPVAYAQGLSIGRAAAA